MITSYNLQKKPIYESTQLRTNLDNYYFISSKDKKNNEKVGPTKQTLSSLEYSILMNHPELDSQTLTSRLFHCSPDDENCLYKKLETKRPSKLVFRALCPNIYIQKLRIIYFLLLTQSYQPLYKNNQLTASQNQTPFQTSLPTSKTTTYPQQQPKSTPNSFRSALDILRAKYYSDSKVDAIKRKYLAQFFQFLEYDSQQLSNRGQHEDPTLNNIVITIMNKYPIVDQIFIDMLIGYIREKCLEVEKELSIDDNYNIKYFIDSMLGVENKFISNWEFIFGGINIVIGTDMFYLDYDRYSYFKEIVQSLKEKEQGDCYNGLDVSNVGGFDEEVFKKLDISYIDDLNDLLSNCSDSQSQLQTDTQNFGPALQHQSSITEHNEKEKLGIRRIQSMSYYHPINVLNSGLTCKKQELALNMKKAHNRTLDSGHNTVQLPRPKVNIQIDTQPGLKKEEVMKPIKQVNDITYVQNSKQAQRRLNNPQSLKNSPIPNSSTSLYQTEASSTKIPSEQRIQSQITLQLKNKQTNPIQYKLASLNKIEPNDDQRNKTIYYNKANENYFQAKKQQNRNVNTQMTANSYSLNSLYSKQKIQSKKINEVEQNTKKPQQKIVIDRKIYNEPSQINSQNNYQVRTYRQQSQDKIKVQQSAKTQRQIQTVKSSFELPKVNSSYEFIQPTQSMQPMQPIQSQQQTLKQKIMKRQSTGSNNSEESKPNLQLHSHVRIIEPIKIYTVSDSSQNLGNQQILQSKQDPVKVRKQEPATQAKISINLANNQVKIAQQPEKKQIVKSLENEGFSRPSSIYGSTQKLQKLSLNIAKVDTVKGQQQENKLYFYMRKKQSSNKLATQQPLEQRAQIQKQPTLPSTSETIIRKPSILKLPAPYVRYEAPRSQSSSKLESNPSNIQKTVEKTPQSSQQGPERQMNKQLIRQLYSDQSKGSATKIQQYDESQKGYVQIRQKIIDSGKKANSINDNEFKQMQEIKISPNPNSNAGQLTQRPTSSIKKAQGYQVPPQDKLSILSNKANSQKSFNQVCSDINQILENLKVTLKKNQSLVTLTSDMTVKTEGQQMWQRHKLKSSHDPQILSKQQISSQLSQQKKPRQQANPNYYIINTKAEQRNNTASISNFSNEKKFINTTQIDLTPKVHQVINLRNKMVENQQKKDSSSTNPKINERQGLLNAIKGSYQLPPRSNILNQNTSTNNSIQKAKHSISINVPTALVDKHILQDKNRVNTNNYNNIKSTSNLVSQPVASSSNGYSPTPYMNRNLMASPSMNSQFPNTNNHQSNPALKLNLNREQKDSRDGRPPTNSQRVRELVKNIGVNTMQKQQQFGNSIQFQSKEQLMKFDMKTPNSPQPNFFGNNNQSLTTRNNPITNTNNFAMVNGGYSNGNNGNRLGVTLKSMESKIKS